MKYLIIGLTVIIFSCKSEAEQQKENIQNTLHTFVVGLLHQTDSTLVLDSFRIISIDTVSSKDMLSREADKLVDSIERLTALLSVDVDLLKLHAKQVKAGARLYSLTGYSGSYEDDKEDFDSKKEEIAQSFEQLNALNAETDSLMLLLDSGTIDSTDFLYYRPIFRVCYSDKLLQQTCKEGGNILITKDFRVLKMVEVIN